MTHVSNLSITTEVVLLHREGDIGICTKHKKHTGNSFTEKTATAVCSRIHKLMFGCFETSAYMERQIFVSHYNRYEMRSSTIFCKSPEMFLPISVLLCLYDK